MAIVIQGLLLINNQNTSANSKNRNSWTHLPKNSKNDLCIKCANFVMNREFIRILYIFL